MRGDLFRQAAEADDVLDQAAELSVMHPLSGRCALVARGDRRISDDCGRQFLQPGIFYRGGEFQKLRVELLHIRRRVREKIGKLDLFGLGAPELLKRELRFIAVDLDARLDFYEVVSVHVASGNFKLIPHARFDRSAAVAELQAQVSLSFPGIANFFFVDEKKSGDGLLEAKIAD